MIKALCVCTIVVCTTATSTAQNTDPSVIAAASGSGKTSNLSIDWTLGENAIETISYNGAMYTQGFHQPGLEVTSLFTKSATGVDKGYNISIAPNPVVSILNFNIASPNNGEVVVSVSDINGKLHIQQKLSGKFSHSQLNFLGLPAGTYILSVRESATAQLLKSYQIIKL